MSNLQVSAARSSFVDPCESIHIDAMDTGAQTDSNMCVDQGVTCINPTVTGEHLKFLYPTLYKRKGQPDTIIIGTLDDMILDSNQTKYLMLRESIRSRAKATIKHASWHHTSKKNAQVDSSAFKPSKPNRPRSDSDYSSPQKEKKKKNKIKFKKSVSPKKSPS